MPIYNFICQKCGHSEDILQSIKAENVKTCPKCGSQEFKKSISAPAFHLKGNGWYKTDFKNK